jgi:uncharacterized linocin/CFP29 family protein
MEILGRENAPFSARVWQEIDAAVNSVKMANTTARRFLEVDGPYGLGLTSLAGDDGWLQPDPDGADPADWGVRRGRRSLSLLADPDEMTGRGTFAIFPPTQPVPMIASEFIVSVRNVEAFDDDCQPLDLIRATRAARDVALEEERLIYYGSVPTGQIGLLNVAAPQPIPQQTPINPGSTLPAMIAAFQFSVEALAARGFGGPYALALSPFLYTRLYGLIAGTNVVLIDLLRRLFSAGIHMAPVIRPGVPGPIAIGAFPLPPAIGDPLGVIVTAARCYTRLVVGQDWATAYRGMSGLYHRFMILDSLCLQVSEPTSLQVLLNQP